MAKSELALFEKVSPETQKAFVAFKKGHYEDAITTFSTETRNCVSTIIHCKDNLELIARTQSDCYLAVQKPEEADKVMGTIPSWYINDVGRSLSQFKAFQNYYYHKFGREIKLSQKEHDKLSSCIQLVKTVSNPYHKGSAQQSNNAYGWGMQRKRRKVSHTDPFDESCHLPNEVISIILNALSLGDLEKASRVSTRWRNKVQTVSRFYSMPTFIQDMSMADMESYQKQCEKFGISTIRQMVIHKLRFGQEAALVCSLANWNVRVLDLKIIVSGDFACNRFEAMKEKFKTAFACTRVLRVHFSPTKSFALNSFIACFTGLEELSLVMSLDAKNTPLLGNTGLKVKNLQTLRWTIVDYQNRMREFAKEVDRFIMASKIVDVDEMHLRGVPLRTKTLTKMLSTAQPWVLSIYDTMMNVWDVLHACNSSGIELTHLRISCVGADAWRRPRDFTDEQLVVPTLKKLDLSAMALYGMSLVDFLRIVGSQLQTLSLTAIPAIHRVESGTTFQDIIQWCPRLKTLEFVDCKDNGLYKGLAAAFAALELPQLRTLWVGPGLTEANLKALFPDWSTRKIHNLRIVGRIDQESLQYLIQGHWAKKIEVNMLKPSNLY